MNNNVNTKEILSVLHHAIELAQDELAQNERTSAIAVNNSALQKKEPTKQSNLYHFRTFHHPEFGDLNATVIDGKPYFEGRTIAAALGYKNPSNTVEYHCSHMKTITADTEYKLPHRYRVISEQDVRVLLSRRRMELIDEFESWLNTEVIPHLSSTSWSVAATPTKQREPDDAVSFREFRHPQYGTMLTAIVDGVIYYRVHDLEVMLGYTSKTLSPKIENKIMLTARNKKAPLGWARSSFAPAEVVHKAFALRKMLRIPVMCEMLDWLTKEIPADLRAREEEHNALTTIA